MADTTVTVAQSGGDETSVSAALTTLKSTWTASGTDLGIIEILDDFEYTETATLDFTGGFSGTISATSYPVLRAASDNWCGGQYANARIKQTSTAHAITVGVDYLHIKGVAIKQGGSTSSAECIRVNNNTDNLLIEKCYLETNNVSSQDCVYASQNCSIWIYDTVMRSGGSLARVCCHCQATSATYTQTWHMNHCLADSNGAEEAYGIDAHSSNTVTYNIYNSVGFGSDGSSDDFEHDMSGTKPHTMTGAYNISSDTSFWNSARNKQPLGTGWGNVTIADIGSDAAGAHYLTTDKTNKDYRLRRGTLAANVAVGRNHTGGSIDTRTDESVDVVGRTRPADGTRDIGPFQSLAAEGVTPSEFTYDETITITAADGGFGTTQSTGTVYLSDTNTVGTGTDVDLDTGTAIDSWSDYEIVINLTNCSAATKSSLNTLGGGTRYVIVDPASGSDVPNTVTGHRAIPFIMSQTTNLTPFGEATTAQLSAPGGKTTGDFDAAWAQCDSNPGKATDVSNADYREDEWCIIATTDAVAGETYDFRVLLGGSALDTYTVTPQWTITAAAGGIIPRVMSHRRMLGMS